MAKIIIVSALGVFFFVLALGIATVITGIGAMEEAAKKKEEDDRKALEMENDEFNYGHNVNHYHCDGEGEL